MGLSWNNRQILCSRGFLAANVQPFLQSVHLAFVGLLVCNTIRVYCFISKANHALLSTRHSAFSELGLEYARKVSVELIEYDSVGARLKRWC